MRRLLLISTVTISIMFAVKSYASPSIFFTARSAGLFKIDIETKSAVNIDSITVSKDFHGIVKYGEESLLVTNHNQGVAYIFDHDGNLLNQYSAPAIVDAIESNDGSGDIYYTDYFASSVGFIDVSAPSTSMLYDFTGSRGYCITQRSNGTIYSTSYSDNGLLRVDTDSIIYTSTLGMLYLITDNHDNIFTSNGLNTIVKIAGTNDSSSVFWADPNIQMYNLFYDNSEDVFYALGETNSIFNIYKISTTGEASVFLSNISGMPAAYWSRLYVYNDLGTAVPEPLTLFLSSLGIIAMWFRKQIR